MKLGTHMTGGERRKPIDIVDRRTKVKSAYNMMNGVRRPDSTIVSAQYLKSEMSDLN